MHRLGPLPHLLEQTRSQFNRKAQKEKIVLKTIKAGTEVSVQDAITTQVEETVKTMLAEIKSGGDAAVRRYSEKLDKFNPKVFGFRRAKLMTRSPR